MTSALDIVLEIAAVGSGLLFLALAGLIGLMYLLTAPWLFGRPETAGEATPEDAVTETDEETAAQPLATAETAGETPAHVEAERQRRAVVLAVTVAVARDRAARSVRRIVATATETTSDWRRAGRMRHFSKQRRRTRARA